MAFLDDLKPLMPHQVLATPVTDDTYGTPTPSGPDIVLENCQIEGVSRMVRDPQGREVVSSYTIITSEFNDLSVDRHIFTLPATYGPPNTNIKPIRVDPVSDEAGQLYEMIFLP